MEPVRKVIDNVKLRASIGSLGNQAIADSYPYIQSLSPSLSTSYLMNGNKNLPEGCEEEAVGHNAIAAGFQGQRQWTDFSTWDSSETA